VDPLRVAVWTIWGSYALLGVFAAAFLFLLEPKRIDIGGVTLALILMGIGSVFIAVAMMAASIVGARLMFSNSSARRAGTVFTVLAGWIGSLLLGWLAWGFWTE
jgi:hypothetical protein